MEEKEIRNELIQFFKRVISGTGYTQLVDIQSHLRNICVQNGWDEKEALFSAREIINEYLNNNVLMWGYGNDMSSTAPWLTVTTFGKECINEENLLPYDPEGYITELTKQVTQIDPITIQYLKECIQTYNKNCLLSSNITLGTASENIILTLIETFKNAISNPTHKTRFENATKDKYIFTQYKEFMKEFNNIQNNLPPPLKKNVEIYLDGIFNFIRLNRNAAGHPTGMQLKKKILYSNIQMFAEYSKRVFELVDYFSSNQI